MKTIKVARITLTWILVTLFSLTVLLALDRCFLHPNDKGVSLLDIQHIVIFLLAPIGITIIIIRLVESKLKKTASQLN